LKFSLKNTNNFHYLFLLVQVSQGKRGTFDFLTTLVGQIGANLQQQFSQIFQQVIAPALHLTVQQASALLAQLTASIGNQ
jgi:hypothetical protein